MADRVVAVGGNGTVYQRADGSAYYLGTFGFPLIECQGGTTPDLAGCVKNTLGTDVLPTLDPNASLALTIQRETNLANVLNLEARSILSFLPAGTGGSILDELQTASLSNPEGLPGLLEQRPDLAAIANAQATQVDAVIDATTVRDATDGLNPYELYLANRDRSALIEASPQVAAERERAMGLLDDLGLSGYTAGSFSPTFTPTLAGSFDPFQYGSLLPSSEQNYGVESPPIQQTGGGILDTIGGVLQSAIPYIPQILTGLSNAGVIRGDVGDAFRTPVMQTPSGGISAAGLSPYALGVAQDPCQAALDQQGYLGYATCKLFGTNAPFMPQNAAPEASAMMPVSPYQLALNSGLCGRRQVARVNVMPATHANLFNQCGGVARRIFVDAPNGATYVLYNAGPATIGANELSLAKRIARRQRLKLVSRGSSGGRRRRPR